MSDCLTEALADFLYIPTPEGGKIYFLRTTQRLFEKKRKEKGEFFDEIQRLYMKEEEEGVLVPSFELASGAQNLTTDDLPRENRLLPQPEALEQGKKAMVKNRITASEKKYKTALIKLSKEAIEAQFGKTMTEAAKALEVSVSTLKRKCKDAGISWQGPSSTKKKVNNSSNQSAKNEEYDGEVQDSSAINKNENTLTIKAKYKKDMIKFHLCMSEATFIIVEEKIGKRFNLTHGTFKLKYVDENNEWFLLASDEDMSCCMKSSRILAQNVVTLRVLPISG